MPANERGADGGGGPVGIERLLEVMATLRDPVSGCPWDREQTARSIVPHTLEEAYEVAAAVEEGDPERQRDELGDLLFQVVFYARMASEAGQFDFDDIVAGVVDKLVRRHPHVFGEAVEADARSQTVSWEAIKAAERAARSYGEAPSALDDIPGALPALSRAVKLQRRAARVGFDWGDPAPVIAKIREELAEVEAAMAAGDEDAAGAEVGDVLFAAANLARHLGVDAEQMLRGTNAKFERRFRRFERTLQGDGVALEDAPFEQLEAAYQRAKAIDQGRDPDAR